MIDYRERLTPVLRALEQDPDLSIEALASRACLSLYHFHRVFTAVVGEAPGEMCRRLRMQRAAWQLPGFRQGVSSSLWLHSGGVSPRQGQERTPGSQGRTRMARGTPLC